MLAPMARRLDPDFSGIRLDILENDGNTCGDGTCCESPDTCLDFELGNLYLYCLQFLVYLFDVGRYVLSHLQEIAFISGHVIPHLAFRYVITSLRSLALSSSLNIRTSPICPMKSCPEPLNSKTPVPPLRLEPKLPTRVATPSL